MTASDTSPEGAVQEVLVVEDPHGALVVGDQSALEAFVAEWDRGGVEIASRTELIGDSRKRAVTTAADLATISTGVAHYFRTKRTLDTGARETVVLRKWVQDRNGKIIENSPINPALLAGGNPTLLLATIALRSALADSTREITAAVERVEGKTDDLLRLAKADRSGDVNGRHRVLSRMVASLEAGTPLSATDWSSVAALGPDLEVTVERLRDYLRRTVQDLPAGLPADERSERLGKAVGERRLGEVLRLLVVSEQSLYLWQRLRVERTQSAEPEHLEQTIVSAHATLAEHLSADLRLVTDLRNVLARYGSLTAFEFHRKVSGRRLRRHLSALRAELDYFVDTRGMQISAWAPMPKPTVKDAITAAGQVIADRGRGARTASNRALDATLQGVGRAGGAVQQKAEQWREGRHSPGRGAPDVEEEI